MFGSCSSSAIGLQHFQAGLGELGHVELIAVERGGHHLA